MVLAPSDHTVELKRWLAQHVFEVPDDKSQTSRFQCKYCQKSFKGDHKAVRGGTVYMPVQGLVYHFCSLQLFNGHPPFWNGATATQEIGLSPSSSSSSLNVATLSPPFSTTNTPVLSTASISAFGSSPEPSSRLSPELPLSTSNATYFLDTYLSHLPDGLASYPEAETRVGIVSTFIEVIQPYLTPDMLSRVPAKMTGILLKNIQRTEEDGEMYSSEVEHMAILALCRDLVAPREDEFFSLMRISMAIYFRRNPTSALLALHDAGIWFTGGSPQATWNRFKRGTIMERIAMSMSPLSGKARFTFRLTFQHQLYDRWMMDGFSECLKVMVSEALPTFLKVVALRGVPIVCSISDMGPTHADFLLENPA